MKTNSNTEFGAIVASNQNVHHNTLMACADIDPQNIELWKETYCQGEKRARNNTRIVDRCVTEITGLQGV